MKRRLAALAAILLIIALYLAANPTTSDMLTSSMGVTNYQTNYDRTDVLSVRPLNYSFFETSLTPGGTLGVSLSANPGNVDVLVMNQGNFSLWARGGEIGYSTYPQSRLGMANYSFVFGSQSTGNFYVILVSHSTDQTTQVIVHRVVTSPSQFESLFLPLVLGLVGVILLGFARRRTRKKGNATKQPAGPGPSPAADEPAAPAADKFCKHCGAAFESGAAFCPSCGKAQD
jgi:hypothetical protein